VAINDLLDTGAFASACARPFSSAIRIFLYVPLEAFLSSMFDRLPAFCLRASLLSLLGHLGPDARPHPYGIVVFVSLPCVATFSCPFLLVLITKCRSKPATPQRQSSVFFLCRCFSVLFDGFDYLASLFCSFLYGFRVWQDADMSFLCVCVVHIFAASVRFCGV
jgi:hypothetical protein